ncbi:hypothetical protein BKA69DRAFT_1060869 [Paraphysoderma sedebokerense]|nr:hypothetical protein BKA69DRAFT_1060869 [Paraphysoderma sedebokerense]
MSAAIKVKPKFVPSIAPRNRRQKNSLTSAPPPPPSTQEANVQTQNTAANESQSISVTPSSSTLTDNEPKSSSSSIVIPTITTSSSSSSSQIPHINPSTKKRTQHVTTPGHASSASSPTDVANEPESKRRRQIKTRPTTSTQAESNDVTDQSDSDQIRSSTRNNKKLLTLSNDAEEGEEGMDASTRRRNISMADLCSIKSVRNGEMTKAATDALKKKQTIKRMRKLKRERQKRLVKGEKVEDKTEEDRLNELLEEDTLEGENSQADNLIEPLKRERERPSSIFSPPGNEEQEMMEMDPDEEDEDDGAGPRVRIVNGEIVIDESSLTLRTNQVHEPVSREIVEEESNRYINQSTFMKKKAGRTPRWTADETEKFYEVIFETDYYKAESNFS